MALIFEFVGRFPFLQPKTEVLICQSTNRQS